MVRTALLEGTPTESIVRGCAIEGADLLIMATHGRSGLRRLVFGSVATGVVRHAEVPVLLIRPHEQHMFEQATWNWWRSRRPPSGTTRVAAKKGESSTWRATRHVRFDSTTAAPHYEL